MCDVIGKPELATDSRFSDHAALLAISGEAVAILEQSFAERDSEEWCQRFEGFIGQWAPLHHTIEAANDPQSVANGYIQPCETADGIAFQLVAAPVQLNEEPPQPGRAPNFNEHGDEILTEMGLDWDAIIDLRMRGVVA